MRRSRVLRHRSGLEDKVIKDLEDRGVKYEYEPDTFDYQQRVRRGVCGECGGKEVFQVRRYTPDLRIGNALYIEIKGKLTSDIRSRMESFLRGHPGFDLRFLFQRDNWITKAHKSKYSDWATRLGVKFYVGDSIPKEWVDGK